MQNFQGILALDTVGVVLAAFGMLNPLLAAFIHVTSELTFISEFRSAAAGSVKGGGFESICFLNLTKADGMGKSPTFS
jgi:hypothetical protein